MTGTKNAVAWFGSRVVNGPQENERTSSRSTSYPLLNVGIHESAEYRSRSKRDGRNAYTLNVSFNDAISSQSSRKFLNRFVFTGNVHERSCSFITACSHRVAKVSAPYSSTAPPSKRREANVDRRAAYADCATRNQTSRARCFYPSVANPLSRRSEPPVLHDTHGQHEKHQGPKPNCDRFRALLSASGLKCLSPW